MQGRLERPYLFDRVCLIARCSRSLGDSTVRNSAQSLIAQSRKISGLNAKP
jgi:hypothetical protein